jgi:hypothetical protein
VEIHPGTRTVVVTGWVNQAEGLIELLACGPKGKTHESVLVLSARPSDLQAGLLLLGLKPDRRGQNTNSVPLAGSAAEIWVEWEAGGSNQLVRAERMIWNEETKSPLPETLWTFTGSDIVKEGFAADLIEGFVATYWDSWAMFNLPLACSGNDEILVVNTELTPPEGTPVNVRFVVPEAPRQRSRVSLPAD